MSESVKDFYNSNALNEWKRLDSPLGKIEFAGTLRLIEKYFPKVGQICDIGGGPGRYTIELIKQGYDVTLLDLSEEEIILAREQLDNLGLSAEKVMVGDAQNLSDLESDSFDAGLLLGPMYHLIEPESRIKALQELARVLKPNGVAIISYLNSWGLIKTGIVDFPKKFQDISFLRSMLNENVFTSQTLSNFTECYWSNPKIAFSEVRKAGFEIKSYAGAESFASGMGSLLAQLATQNPETFENVFRLAAETGELPQYRDSTDHLHIVVSAANSSSQFD